MVKLPTDFYMDALWRCGGYYQCVKDASGQRLSPLVGYPGRYDVAEGSPETKQYVGETFINLAIVEQYPHILDKFAKDLAKKVLDTVGEVDYVVAAPLNGMALGKDLSRHLDCRYVFAERKIVGLRNGELREQSELQMIRHEIDSGSRVIVVEDVCNNFSVTAEMVSLIQRAGSEVCAATCALNRSGVDRAEIGGDTMPVIGLARITMSQFRQDDPAVAEDIKNSNVMLEPRKNWTKLMKSMKDAISAAESDPIRKAPTRFNIPV